MKTWYERVGGPCSHSSSNKPSDHEDVSEVDQILLRLYKAVDIQEAVRCNNLLDKDNVNNASQFLAPNHQHRPSRADISHNPLNSLTNEAPAVVSELSPKLTGTKNR
jgi:hypothetical protein